MTDEHTSAADWSDVRHEVPEWFRDAKLGMFFHWGPYSVPAYMNEWYSRNMYCRGLEQNRYHEEHYGRLHDFGYKDFIPMMTGKRFDPAEWAQLVKRTGARYAGPVTEHADNFSMWDSRVNPVNSMAMGPHRDVFGECAEAFRKEGLRVLATFHHQWLWGWFMSTDNEADVYDPANEVYYGPALPLETNRYLPYRLPDEKFSAGWLAKVNEVVDKYSPDALYFDSRACILDEHVRHAMARHYYEKTGAELGVITYKQEDFPRGTGVLDLECGRFAAPKPFVWQCDDRLEDRITWCYVQDAKYKQAKRIIHQLCDVVSKNGNLLLNVGPRADGSFHPDAVRELEKIGDWLQINGEAVYGSRPWIIAAEGPSTVNDEDYDAEKLHEQIRKGNGADVRFAELGAHDFRFTTGNGHLYAIAMGWPENGCFEIQSLGKASGRMDVHSVTMLGSGGALSFLQTEEALAVRAPGTRPCDSAYVLKID